MGSNVSLWSVISVGALEKERFCDVFVYFSSIQNQIFIYFSSFPFKLEMFSSNESQGSALTPQKKEGD